MAKRQSKRQSRRRGRGEGTITQRADGRWMGQLTVGWNPETRKQERVTVYGDTQAECREKLDEARRKRADGESPGQDMTLAGFMDYWLDSQRRALAPESLDRYRLSLSYLKPHMGGLTVTTLTSGDVTNLHRRMEAGGLSTAARRAAGKLLRQALAYAVNKGWRARNPTLADPLPRHTAKEMRPLTIDEMNRLVFWANYNEDRLRALYVVALDTGARFGELLALTWEDFDEARGTLRIVKSLQNQHGRMEVREPKTRASRRTLVLGPTALASLRDHRTRMVAEGHGSPIIFCTRRGGYYQQSTIRRINWKPLLKEAGLKGVRFHDLRHTYATLALMSGNDVLSVAHRLGHASAAMTLKVYGHVLPEMAGKAASVLDNHLVGP